MKQNGNIELGFALLLVGVVIVFGMFLVAHNSNDVFTQGWSLFGQLIAYSKGG